MRWYSPFDWIPGPETEEEMEELRRLRKETDKQSEESSATILTGMKIEDRLCNLLNERVFLANRVRNIFAPGSRYMSFRAWHSLCVISCLAPTTFFPRLETVTCFPALRTRHVFSRAWHPLHVVPRLALLTCFTTLRTHCVIYSFPVLDTRYVVSRAACFDWLLIGSG